MGPDTWQLRSLSGTNPSGYTVTKVKENCTDCEGQPTLCTAQECAFLCWHMYTCDKGCYDYNNGHVCKHIHRVHSINVDKHRKHTGGDDTMEPPSPSLIPSDATEDNTLDITYVPSVARVQCSGMIHTYTTCMHNQCLKILCVCNMHICAANRGFVSYRP